MDCASKWRPAGMPLITHTSAGPCDSPAVVMRSVVILDPLGSGAGREGGLESDRGLRPYSKMIWRSVMVMVSPP